MTLSSLPDGQSAHHLEYTLPSGQSAHHLKYPARRLVSSSPCPTGNRLITLPDCQSAHHPARLPVSSSPWPTTSRLITLTDGQSAHHHPASATTAEFVIWSPVPVLQLILSSSHWGFIGPLCISLLAMSETTNLLWSFSGFRCYKTRKAEAAFEAHRLDRRRRIKRMNATLYWSSTE